jgi:putative transposase
MPLEPGVCRSIAKLDRQSRQHYASLHVKRDRIRRKVYRTRDESRADVCDDIEMFWTPTRSMHETGCCRPSLSNGGTKREPRAF